MPEEILYITFIAMVAVIMVNIVCAIDHKREQRHYERRHKQLIDWLFGSRTEHWKRMGAYEAPEKGQLYLDLEGIRLVIENGELDGWYIP